MKAGILSDTHDNRKAVGAALALFRREGVGLVLHLGDVCGGGTLAAIAASGIPLVGVYGNGDRDRDGIGRAADGAFAPGPRIEAFAGRRVLMAHTFRELEPEIGEGGRFDLILFGHTHRPLTMRIGRALVLNPGEGGGFTSGRATCAVVDLAAMEARILPIPEDGNALAPGIRSVVPPAGSLPGH